MSADPILTPEQVRAERNIADGAAGWRVPIQKLCDSHESLRARAAELESAIARLYVVACPGWASDGTATNMLANIERRAAELEATIARLSEQSRAISVLLSDAGVNAMPIVEGVRTLVSRLDMTRGHETCTYCGHNYPFPVSLHHDNAECAQNLKTVGLHCPRRTDE